MEARICQIVDVSPNRLSFAVDLYGRSKLGGCLDAGEWIWIGFSATP